MIESSYDITRFLPIQIGDEDIIKYIRYHADNLDKSIEHNIESGIFFHVHILYMTFIYFQLLRISQKDDIKKREAIEKWASYKTEFELCWIWFPNEEKKFLDRPNSPFAFSWVKEKSVFRFFRLINFTDSLIGEISKCVTERNELSHASGMIVIDLDQKIDKYINNMKKVVDSSKVFIKSLYDQCLDDNSNWFEVGYSISRDDIETNLLIPYSISSYEIENIIMPVETNSDLNKLYEDYR